MQNIVILTSARIRQNSYSQVNIISAKDFFQSIIKPNEMKYIYYVIDI